MEIMNLLKLKYKSEPGPRQKGCVQKCVSISWATVRKDFPKFLCTMSRVQLRAAETVFDLCYTQEGTVHLDFFHKYGLKSPDRNHSSLAWASSPPHKQLPISQLSITAFTTPTHPTCVILPVTDDIVVITWSSVSISVFIECPTIY